MNRQAIITALELCGGLCCDDAEDREKIADRVERTLRDQREALQVREFFVHAVNPGTRLIAFSASHGAVQSKILEAAWRLAGGK